MQSSLTKKHILSTDLVRRAINHFSWQRAFYNTNVTKKVSTFIETILNVFCIYVYHETLTCDDKDPPWFNFWIKSLLHDESKVQKDCRRGNTNTHLLKKLNHLQEELNFLKNKTKLFCTNN